MRTRLFIFLLILTSKSLFSQDEPSPFTNGESPSTFRYFFPEVNEDGYSMMIFQTEGMDHLNFFGSRLLDLNGNGKEDISMRVLENLSTYFNSPSTKERSFIRGNIDENFKMEILYDDYIVKDGTQYPYHYTDQGYYYFNFDFADFTVINQIGEIDWRKYFQENNFIENRDYAIMDNQFIHTIPRLYFVENGKITDATIEKLEFSNELDNSTAKFMHNQSVASGDFNADGKADVFTIGIHQFMGTDLEDLDIGNRVIPYLFENNSNGNMKVSHLDFISDLGTYWGVSEGTYHLSVNLDEDEEEEILSEVWFSDESPDPFQVPETTRYLGYFDFNIEDKSIEFIKIFDSSEYLKDPEWSISPRYMKKISPTGTSDRDLAILYFTSTAGSPPSEVGRLDVFNPNYTQRYLKVYEIKSEEASSNKLIDVTSEFFELNENETFSLDNNGLLYLIDVDNDGLEDIYIQSGETPVSGRWDSDFINEYPSWNKKPNTLFYFKQTEEGRFKLTDLATINGFFFPNNFEGDFSVFDDNGVYRTNGKDFRIENFTLFNQASLNDIDNDGQFEILSSSDPNYLNVFSKSQLPTPDFNEIEITSINFEYKYEPIPLERYDFSRVEFSKDTVFSKVHDGFNLIFELNDEKKKVTHAPILSGIYDLGELFTSHLPISNRSEKRDLNSDIIKLKFEPDPNREITPDKNYISPYLLRFDDDFVVKSHQYYLTSENTPPLPFFIKEIVKENSDNFQGFKVSFSTSIDVNQNFYEDEDGNVFSGVKYGYELYNNDQKVLTKTEGIESFDLIYSDDPNEENFYPKITNFKIPSEGYSLDELSFKVFAIDTTDPSLITYAKHENISDFDGDGVSDDVDQCPNTPTGEEVSETGCSSSQLDTDGDGVMDDMDTCPDTPSGVIVDSNGCEFFSLPENVFSVNTVSSTCVGSDNGSINLSTSDSSFNYLYSVDGSDPLPFQNDVTISGLETGSYQVCFTVEGVSNYNRCYTVNVVEPDALEASSMVDMDNRTISLNLSGSKSYNILLNGKSISTDNSIISLPLKSGKNTIEVKGDQECQGLYFEEIFVSEEVKVYPNPTNGPLQLYISGMDNQVIVDVTSINGTVVMSSIQSVPMNRVIELNLSDLNPGMYIVSVKGANLQVHQKVIRK